MLMLEARDICGGATGRNGQFSTYGRTVSGSVVTLWKESKADESAIQEVS